MNTENFDVNLYIKSLEAKKNEAIKLLLEEKEALENSSDTDADLIKEKLKEIQTAIDCIVDKHEETLRDFMAKYKGDLPSLTNLDKEVANIEKNIEQLRDEHTRTLAELNKKKKELRDRLKSLENLDSIINELGQRIRCSNLEYTDKMKELESLRENLVKSANLDEEDILERLIDLEHETQATKKTHKTNINQLEHRKKILEKEHTIKYRKLQKLKDECELSESTPESTSTLTSEASRMTLADTVYLKSAIGNALTLGLAEILAKKPADPIHYLSHWLYKYRLNEDSVIIRKHELDQLLAERERVADQIRRRQLEIDAYQAVIDMVRRAEEDAERRAYELTLEMLKSQQEGEEG